MNKSGSNQVLLKGGDTASNSRKERHQSTGKVGSNKTMSMQSQNASRTTNSFFNTQNQFKGPEVQTGKQKSKSQYKSFDGQKNRELNLSRPTFTRANGPNLSIEGLNTRSVKPYYQPK